VLHVRALVDLLATRSERWGAGPAAIRLRATFAPGELAEAYRELVTAGSSGRPHRYVDPRALEQSEATTLGTRVVSLIHEDGNADDSTSWASFERSRPTPALDSSPVLRKLIDSIPAPIRTARLLGLQPGACIEPHRDAGSGFAAGILRLHVPVVTNDGVEFWVGSERQKWQTGELWYADFRRLHSVANRGTQLRVHLVLDVGITPELMQLFPERFAQEQTARGIFYYRWPLSLQAPTLSRYESRFLLPAGFIRGVDRELEAALEVDGAVLRLVVSAELPVELGAQRVSASRSAVADLVPTGPETLAVLGAQPAYTWEYESRGGARSALWVVNRCVATADYRGLETLSPDQPVEHREERIRLALR